MPLTKKKTKFRPDQDVVALTTFSLGDATVHRGDKFKGGDDVVLANPLWFSDGEVPDHEVPSMWAEVVPPPPDFRPPPGATRTIEPHRQVRSTVDTWTSMPWAPGSPGSKGGIMPPPVGGGLKRGGIYDVGEPIVSQHPEYFVFPERPVSLEDIRRLTSEDKED
jgi:hypothetical protein